MTISTETFLTVGVGSVANDGTGDTLRTAFIKVNDNFQAITEVGFDAGNINVAGSVEVVGNVVANYLIGNGAQLTGLEIALGTAFAFLEANAAVQAGELADLTTNAAVQAGELSSLLSNAAVQAGELATLVSNAASQAGAITDLESNAAAQAGLISAIESNLSVQIGLILAAEGNITTANTAMKGYVDGEISTLNSNAASQAGAISSLESNAAVQAGSISELYTIKANISGPTFTGNIAADNFLGNVPFTMANITHWTSNVSTLADAINQLAERIYNIENP